MMFIRKLAFSNFAVRKVRVGLTIAAVALSVSLVVAVTSGYASLFEAAFKFLNLYMGSTDARVDCPNHIYGVPTSVVEELRGDPDVRRADGRLDLQSQIPDREPDAAPEATKSVRLIGIERPLDRRVDRLNLESGQWFDTSEGHVAVVDQAVASLMQVKVGDTFTLPYSVDKKMTLSVVGIAHKPAVVAQHLRTIYLPMRTLHELVPKSQGFVSNVLVDLKAQVNVDAFKARWTQKLGAITPPMKIHFAGDLRQQMDKQLQSIKMMSYLGGAVSMLSATFIVFSALSMGVTERQRSLAMLRAVGAYRSQIGKLVVFEGALLAIFGLLIGVPLGWIWIKILTLFFRDLFTAGAILSWQGVLFGTIGTLVTALLASLLPAWSATRVRPLEAMAPLAQPTTDRAPLGWAAIGLLLASIDPFVFFGPLPAIARMLGAANPAQAVRPWKYYLHFSLGLPGLFLGFFLLSPLCVWLTERLAGPLVARLFGLRFALLRQQISTGIWRAAGTCSALMVGLTVLIVLQVTGHTMLHGWQLPDKFPDIFIGTMGLTHEEQDQLAKTPGIKTLMPITIAATSLGKLGGNPFAIAGTLTMPDATMFIGFDPDKAMDMMQLDFREGDPKAAAAKLNQGDWVIVTEEYRQLTNCKIGDEIILGRGHVFHIAAVVWSPGLDVMAGMYDMGDQLEQRTVSSVFGSIADSEKYFGAQAYIFAAELELEPHVEREPLTKEMRQRLKNQGLQVGDVRELKAKIENGFNHLLNLMSTVALAALIVASLGVTNTIMAGVRSRRWQFGVLRSIGVTRGQLLRLVLAEAFILGIIACVLGTGAGFEMTFDATALTAAIAGYRPGLDVPWAYVIGGLASVLAVSQLASLWPALDASRSSPLTLLQAGRASV